MAQRYGGKFSPDDTGQAGNETVRPFDEKVPARAGARVNFLFLLPFPFLISAFRSEPVGLALNLACFALLLLAAWLTRDGVKAQEAYDSRKVARRPAIPRKMFGSLLTGLGLALAGVADGSMVNAIVFGLLGVVLHSAAFGLDPMKGKGVDEIDKFQSDRVARAVTEAEAHLTTMTDAISRCRDRELETRVDRFAGTARRMFRTVEEDPRDLTAARRFLSVYLQGARDATTKFVDFYGRTRDPQARTEYVALLDDLEKNFAAKTETLLLDDKSNLDVEIEVLRERLERETH